MKIVRLGRSQHPRRPLLHSSIVPYRLSAPLECLKPTPIRYHSIQSSHEATLDGRARLSRFWVPPGGTAAVEGEDAHAKLVRAGFLRQAHSGIFHLLPLGRRVQDKLEALIDKHMYSLGASKVALSTISSEEIWTKSGRLGSAGSELFRFKDRKEVPYLLSPTHEEEITSLVSSSVNSYKDLPVRLYQITRKYRDERRPRQGLLRSREFVMKDLYTFDYNPALALKTYNEVRAAYARLFDEIKLPYLVAEADSGNIGGKLSHEFHFPTFKGEDNVISCTGCDYVANEELAESPVQRNVDAPAESSHKLAVVRRISHDRRTLINIWFLAPDSGLDDSLINMHAIKAVIPEIDPSIEEPLPLWKSRGPSGSLLSKERRLVNLLDGRLRDHAIQLIKSNRNEREAPMFPPGVEHKDITVETVIMESSGDKPLNLLRIQDGDPCPRCSVGRLAVQKAIELGHTFHLGTRYSEPMMANVAVPTELVGNGKQEIKTEQLQPMQMGCHGIGVSRMIGAVADTLADDKGLNWPRVMAPFEIVIISTIPTFDADEVYDRLSARRDGIHGPHLDVVYDDRSKSFAWKMQDADLVGYPVIVVMGRKWKEKICEVQCRRLGVREEVHLNELLGYVSSLLVQL